ncbi:hypothetical protein U9M48_026956 [Paspalum notatum var. saurae]|uniref:CW-type domain-containing protein n=1 Tax=Paspalum notatum var. saurae TaxID=547442 RepID=A0AAQ3TVK7_PASNO
MEEVRARVEELELTSICQGCSVVRHSHLVVQGAPPPSPRLRISLLQHVSIVLPQQVKKKDMGGGSFDLNEEPYEDRGRRSDYVLLQKDSKNICCAEVYDLPFKVPLVWSIVKFMPNEAYQRSDFSKFSLRSAPEDDHQGREWERFMCYLRDSKKAATVTFGSTTFYILAPQHGEDTNFSRAVLLYERKQNGPGDYNQMGGQSAIPPVRQLNSLVPMGNVAKRSYRGEFKYGLGNQKPYLNEEISESGPPNEMDNSSKHHEGKKSTTTTMKNFFVSNPSFLRTLSEAHDSWIFGALAELIDNSRDARASRLDISIESMFLKREDKYVDVLCVVDDGHGMNYCDMMRMISFGNKEPNKHCPDKIGRCGVGFKTGTMKLGKDVVVLSQTSSSRSVAFLSQSFNEEKGNVEIPVVTYRKEGQHMELDLSIQSEATAKYHLNAIKEFSPFTEYYLGEKIGIFGKDGSGTQIFIWNLDRWGTDYTLEWHSEKSSENPVHKGLGDILIRSRRARSRQGQLSNKVPLDYSLQSYLEVMFLNPRMKTSVQGSLVKSRPLAETLNNISVISGDIMGKIILLTLGMSKVEYERMNCGIFLYWHGRLIEPYKRVGGQKHSADTGRGLIGVADVTDLIDEEDGRSWVLNNKQGFKDCEVYAKLEEWLGRKVDEYWDTKCDSLQLIKGGQQQHYEAHDEWVQCYSCRKWRMLNAGVSVEALRDEWFCYMPPFNGKCESPEQQMGSDVIIIGEKRSGYNEQNRVAQKEKTLKKEPRSGNIEPQRTSRDDHAKNTPAAMNKQMPSSNSIPLVYTISSDDDPEGVSSQTEDTASHPNLKRLRGFPQSCKEKGIKLEGNGGD